jgi:hypothetical protein
LSAASYHPPLYYWLLAAMIKVGLGTSAAGWLAALLALLWALAFVTALGAVAAVRIRGRRPRPGRARFGRRLPPPLDRACGPWTEGWDDRDMNLPASVGEDGRKFDDPAQVEDVRCLLSQPLCHDRLSPQHLAPVG